MVWGLGFRVEGWVFGSGVGVYNLGFRIKRIWYTLHGLGFRVKGLGFWV